MVLAPFWVVVGGSVGRTGELLVPAHEDSVPKATRGFPIVRGL